jgi:hypothetical protein
MAYITRTDTVPGSYGSGQTPCLIFTARLNNGATWYAVEGSQNVNLTSAPVEPGVWVEELPDHDYFCCSAGIDSEEELAERCSDRD